MVYSQEVHKQICVGSKLTVLSYGVLLHEIGGEGEGVMSGRGEGGEGREKTGGEKERGGKEETDATDQR